MNTDAEISKRKSITRFLRTRFLTGLFTVIPAFVTIIVIIYLFNFVGSLSDPHLNRLFEPDKPPAWFSFLYSVLLLLFIFMVIVLIGMLSRTVLLRKLFSIGEKLVYRIPIAKWVYNTSKQLIELFQISHINGFQRVVALEYPRKGIITLGFVTGVTEFKERDRRVNVFVPTTPNPTSGYLVVMSPAELWDVNLTLEQGIKMIISGGIITPKTLHLKTFQMNDIDRNRLEETNEEQPFDSR